MSSKEKYRAVLSSTHTDSRGDVVSKEMLEKMVETINLNNSRLRMGVDHRRDFPPMGRLENAGLVERDGHFLVEADFVSFENSAVPSWNRDFIIESFDEKFQFAEVDSNEVSSISVSVDPHSFSSFKDVLKLKQEVETATDLGAQLNLHGRKSLIPDPEIVFTFTKSFLLYHLLKPAAKKIGEKIADKLSDMVVDEGEKVTALISKTIKEIFFRCIPKARPVAVIFEIPGKPHIELIARTRDEKIVLKSLSKKRMNEMKKELDDLSKNVSISKIQFLLSEKGKWKFNYLITDKGEAIGTKVSFTRRDRKFEMMGKEKPKKRLRR